MPRSRVLRSCARVATVLTNVGVHTTAAVGGGIVTGFALEFHQCTGLRACGELSAVRSGCAAANADQLVRTNGNVKQYIVDELGATDVPKL
jgi:hypothetical protein